MSHILTSLHGNRLGLDKDSNLVIPVGQKIGPNGAQVDSPSGSRLAFFDDFLAAVINIFWTLTKGSDVGCAVYAIAPGLANGEAVGSTGASATGTEAVNGTSITSGLNYLVHPQTTTVKPCDIVAEARFEVSAITNINVFFGFTDNIALEAPVIGSGVADGITTNATNAVGFLFDTSMTTKKLWLVGVATDVDAAKQDTGIALVAGTMITLRVEVDQNSNARFFINGAPVGQIMAAAVTANVLLTPVLNAFTKTAASATVNVDYINVSGQRS